MRSHRAARYRLVAILVLAGAFLAAGVSPYWRMSPDSALYLGIAQSVASGRGYTFSGVTQYSVPPVVPLYLAAACRAGRPGEGETGFRRLFTSRGYTLEPGRGLRRAVLLCNAFIAAVAFAGLLAAYLLARELAGTKRALWVLLLLATSMRYFSISVVPLTDVVYCAVSTAALLCVVRMQRRGGWGWWAATAALVVLAVLTRLVAVALVLSAAGCFLVGVLRRGPSRRRAAVNLLAILPGLVAAAVFLYIIRQHRAGAGFNYWRDLLSGWSAGGIVKRLAGNLASLPGVLFETIVSLESIAGLGVLLAAVVVWGAFSAWKKGAAFAVGYLACGVVFVSLGYSLQERYLTAFLPLVYLFLIEGLASVSHGIEKRPAGAAAAKKLRSVAVGFAVMVIAVNCFYIAREIARNFSGDFYASYRHGKYLDYGLAAEYLADRPPQGKIMAPHGNSRILSVMSGADTAPPPFHPEMMHVPGVDEIAEYVRGRGVTAILVDRRVAGSARVFTHFIENGPFKWRQTARFGRLFYHVLEGDSPPPSEDSQPAPGG